MPKAKFTAALYLLVIFLSGGTVGAFAYRLYMVKTVLSLDSTNSAPRRLSPVEWRKHFLADMQAKVKLDSGQTTALQQVLDQTDEEFHQLHAKRKSEDQAVQNHVVEKINALLRDEQKPLDQQFRADREAERERERKRRQPEGDTKK